MFMPKISEISINDLDLLFHSVNISTKHLLHTLLSVDEEINNTLS